MRGPVQDTRVDAIMPGVGDVVRAPSQYPAATSQWALFVGTYMPNGQIQVIGGPIERQTTAYVTPTGNTMLRNAAVQLSHAPHAYLISPSEHGLTIGRDWNSALASPWAGPMAAVLLDQEPTAYQASRLVQTLARML